MVVFTRDVFISSNDLGKAATLALGFDPSDDLFVDRFPVVSQVIQFPAHGSFTTLFPFSSQLAVCTPIVESNKIVGNSDSVDIDPGQKTDLTPQGFTPPVAGLPDQVQVSNKSGKVQDISLDFKLNGHPPPNVPMLYLPAIGDGSVKTISPNFSFTVQGYITSDYQEGQILQAPITQKPIWVQDLAALPKSSSWLLTYDPATDHYAIVPSN